MPYSSSLILSSALLSMLLKFSMEVSSSVIVFFSSLEFYNSIESVLFDSFYAVYISVEILMMFMYCFTDFF